MKKGYILLTTIFIMAIGLICITFLFGTISENSKLHKNFLDLVQADYIAESAIDYYLSKEELTEDIRSIYYRAHTRNKDFIKGITILGQHVNLNIKIIKNPTQPIFEIESKTTYKDIDSNWYAYGNVINEMYTKGVSVVNQRTCELKNKSCTNEELNEFKNALDVGKTNLIQLPSEDLFLEQISNKLKFYRIGENGFEEIISTNNVLIYLKQRGGSLTVLNEVSMQGVMDVEHINLESNIKIDGIFNLVSDITSLGYYNVKVNGLTLNIDQVSENNLLANYNYTNLKTQSLNLKNFIKPEIIYTSKEKK